MSLAEPPEGTERRDRTGPPRHLRRASSPGAPGSEELQFCYCRQKQHGLMVCCDGCGEWFHSRCVELQKAPQDDETWYCVRCTAEARGVRGKRGREEAEPRWGLKAPRTAPSWRSLIQKQFLEPGDRLYFVKDIAKCQLRHTHEGIVTDMEGRITHVGPNGPDAVYPSLAAWCAALGGKPKSPFAGVFTAAFLPLDHLRQRCAYGLAPPREGPVPWSPREAPTLPIALWAGAAELDGSLGPDRCFRLRLRYRRKPTISDRAEILRLLSDVVDAVLGMNMYWLPENRAGRRPLLYRVTLDRGIVHILAQSVWRYARACPWSVSDQRTADAADAAVHVDVLHVDPAQKAHGVARAARHFEGLIERLRPKPADPRLECRRALDEAVGQCRGDGVKSAPYHLVYLNGLTMVKDFLTAKVDGVNQLLAYLGTEGNGQVAHLEDFVRGCSVRDPILHLAAVNLVVASAAAESKAWYCADKDCAPGERVLRHMNTRNNGCPFYVQHRETEVQWDAFEEAVLQREGDLIIQPMWCIHQVSNLCQSIAISQNVYPFPAEFIPPPDPFFQPYSARCTCGLSSIVIDDGVYQMASSLGIGDLRDPPAPK